MTDRVAFPDIERALVNLLVDLVGGNCANIGTQTPPNLQGAMPFIRVQRTGGGDDSFTDSPVVSIDTFASDRDVSFELSESIRQRLITPTTPVVNGVKLDLIQTATSPNEVPWSSDQTVRRFAAVYHVSARRVPNV